MSTAWCRWRAAATRRDPDPGGERLAQIRRGGIGPLANREQRMFEGTSLRRHLIDELRDLLDAEQQLTRALPRFAEAAAAPALRQAFQSHLKETRRHLERLTWALTALGEQPRAKRCIGMRGLISEGNSMVGGAPKGALRDAILISGAQRVEHYEMAAYGTARTYAEVLGRADIARLLADTLQEEKDADFKLTEIAADTINERAAEEWHKQEAGILNQSAEWMGQTVGAAARTVRRAAGAVGLAKFDGGQTVDSVRDAAAATGATVADTAKSVLRQGRRLSTRAARTTRAIAADATGSKSKGKTRKRGRRSAGARPARGGRKK
jgi:ferritin-like metal-binding protein YciE